ncbi:MAG: hypothetical protein AAGF11_00520 [Myxococcota bacterium]
MFEDTKPNVVVFGDSNTVSLGPAWAAALVRTGWPASQIVVHHRAGTTPRHWLPKTHSLHHSRFGALWTRRSRNQPALRDALSAATRLVIIGLGGNMMPGSRDEPSVEALLDQVVALAPSARLVWRGPPPSTATRDGVVASRTIRASRYRRNGMLKHLLAPLHFEVNAPLDPAAERVYLDVLALHACGPTRGLSLGTGRDADYEAERRLVASLAGDRFARGEKAVRGPWTSFVRARDSLPSHVPRAAAVELARHVAERGYLQASRHPLRLPLPATVVDRHARLRRGPPDFAWIRGHTLEYGRRVLLRTWRGRFGEVLDARTREPLGWTLRVNVLPDSSPMMGRVRAQAG